jgi:hypothetical protein
VEAWPDGRPFGCPELEKQSLVGDVPI